MREDVKKSFDNITEIAKQLITLSSALVAASISLKKFIFPNSTDAIYTLYFSWAAFILTAIFGILALGAIASELGNTEKTEDVKTVSAGPIITLLRLQQATFIAAMILSVFFAYSNSI